MSVLGGVFDSLQAMSLLQLLLAFIACGGYALAQGRLVGPRARRSAALLAALAAAGFGFESSEWAQATMLLAFAVAGLGVFAALAWLTSRALGFARAPAPIPAEDAPAEAGTTPPLVAPIRATRPGEPAHST